MRLAFVEGVDILLEARKDFIINNSDTILDGFLKACDFLLNLSEFLKTFKLIIFGNFNEFLMLLTLNTLSSL